MLRRFRIPLILLLVVGAMIGVVGWSRLQDARAAAELRRCIVGRVVIEATPPPKYLPQFLDSAAGRWLEHFYGENEGALAHDQLRSYFRGPFDSVGIYSLEEIRGDLGAALAGLPHVRSVIISFDSGIPHRVTEAQLRGLNTRLRGMPHLEELVLEGAWVTDDSLAPLAGHPRLNSILVKSGKLTPRCTVTFASMPALRELYLGDLLGKRPIFAESDEAIISAALPSVRIEFWGRK